MNDKKLENKFKQIAGLKYFMSKLKLMWRWVVQKHLLYSFSWKSINCKSWAYLKLASTFSSTKKKKKRRKFLWKLSKILYCCCILYPFSRAMQNEAFSYNSFFHVSADISSPRKISLILYRSFIIFFQVNLFLLHFYIVH